MTTKGLWQVALQFWTPVVASWDVLFIEFYNMLSGVKHVTMQYAASQVFMNQ